MKKKQDPRLLTYPIFLTSKLDTNNYVTNNDGKVFRISVANT